MEENKKRVLRNKRPSRKRPQDVEINPAIESNEAAVESNNTEVALNLTEKEFQTPATNSFLNAVSKSVKKNRWLMAALFTTILLAIGAQIFLPLMSEEIVSAESTDIPSIDPKALKGGEQLLIAKISNATLIAVANQEWNSLSAEQKRDKLKTILEQSAQFNFKNVLLFNSKGDTIGKATGKEINLY